MWEGWVGGRIAGEWGWDFGLSEGPNLNPSLGGSDPPAARLSRRAPSRSRCGSAPLPDGRASFVHGRRALSLASLRGTSMELCGLLRKTGAKIPAGPFRYSGARQRSGHFGTERTQPAANKHGRSGGVEGGGRRRAEKKNNTLAAAN